MGYFKSISMDIVAPECETMPYPNSYSETPHNYTPPSLVYGLFADSRLVELYSRKDTADYECYLCRMGDEATHTSRYTQYQVLPIKVCNHAVL